MSSYIIQDVSTLGSSNDSLRPRLRFDRSLGVESSTLGAAPLRRPGRESRLVSAAGDASREAIERPRLCEDAELIARFLRLADSRSVLMVGVDWSAVAAWLRLVFLSRVREVLNASGDEPLSLIGLTSSGRGRAGDVGECGMLKRGVRFHGVDEPGVSIDSRGREARVSECGGITTLGVCEICGYPIGTGVCASEVTAPGVLGTLEETEVLECFRDVTWEEG
jgi:hypothetical protein